MDFTGKAFLIMGATSGVGKAVCHLLSEEGALLFLTGRDIVKLDELRNSLTHPERHGISHVEITEDSYAMLLQELINFAKEHSLDGISGGVYCPGIFPLLSIKALNVATIAEIFHVNYTGAMMMTKILSKNSVRNKCETSIIFLTSVSGKSGQKGYAFYGASKAALAASTRALALELAPHNIRLNCVCCGHVETAINIERSSILPEREERLRIAHPLGIGSPIDAANAIGFLLSDKSKWITGTEMVVDGGFLA